MRLPPEKLENKLVCELVRAKHRQGIRHGFRQHMNRYSPGDRDWVFIYSDERPSRLRAAITIALVLTLYGLLVAAFVLLGTAAHYPARIIAMLCISSTVIGSYQARALMRNYLEQVAHSVSLNSKTIELQRFIS